MRTQYGESGLGGRARRIALAELAAAIKRVEAAGQWREGGGGSGGGMAGSRASDAADLVPTGWDGIVQSDSGLVRPALTALRRGVIHEWFGVLGDGVEDRVPHFVPQGEVCERTGAVDVAAHEIAAAKSCAVVQSALTPNPSPTPPGRGEQEALTLAKASLRPDPSPTPPVGRGGQGYFWLPPLGILVHLARMAMGDDQAGRSRCVLWIGRRCWPYLHALVVGGAGIGSGASRCEFHSGCRTLASASRATCVDCHVRSPTRRRTLPCGTECGAPSTSSTFTACSGAGVWPANDRRLCLQSIFVDPGNDVERVWAIDLALRSPAVATVVADGSGLKMAQSRRLQVAAMSGGGRDGGGALALLARPPRELRQHSVAATRWLVRDQPTIDECDEIDEQPRWAVELLRCKGVQPVSEGARRWTVQRDHETGAVRLAADVRGRSGAAPNQSLRQTA